jgi:CBS domain-containing protein
MSEAAPPRRRRSQFQGSLTMTVATILASKGRDVVTIAPDRSLLEAARLLAERKIGVLVAVQPDGAIAGILSERDIVRAVGLHGASVLEHSVSRHMTERVIGCAESDTAVHVMGMMTSGRFRHMPVIEQGKLAGLISIGDVVKRRLSEMENEQKAMIEYISQAA